MTAVKSKILLLNSETLFADAFIATLKNEYDFHHARDIHQMQIHLCDTQYDLIILELHLFDVQNGFSILDMLLENNLRVLVLSGAERDADIRATYYIGAHGFLHKTCDLALARRAMDIILHGGLFFPAHILEKVRDMPSEALPNIRLTELAVLDLLCASAAIPANSQIAETIFLSLQHVKNLTGNLFTAFKIRTRHGLVQEAKRRGFVSGVKLRRHTTKGRRKYLLAAGQHVYQRQPEKQSVHAKTRLLTGSDSGQG